MHLQVTYEGPRKLYALIAIRKVFGMGIKESKEVLEHPEGFVCTQLQWIALRGQYMLKAHTTAPNLNINDWHVQKYVLRMPLYLSNRNPMKELT
jgi:hypothetical protein